MEIIISTLEHKNSSASLAGSLEIEINIEIQRIKTSADIDRAIASLQRQRMVLASTEPQPVRPFVYMEKHEIGRFYTKTSKQASNKPKK